MGGPVRSTSLAATPTASTKSVASAAATSTRASHAQQEQSPGEAVCMCSREREMNSLFSVWAPDDLAHTEVAQGRHDVTGADGLDTDSTFGLGSPWERDRRGSS